MVPDSRLRSLWLSASVPILLQMALESLAVGKVETLQRRRTTTAATTTATTTTTTTTRLPLCSSYRLSVCLSALKSGMVSVTDYYQPTFAFDCLSRGGESCCRQALHLVLRTFLFAIPARGGVLSDDRCLVIPGGMDSQAANLSGDHSKLGRWAAARRRGVQISLLTYFCTSLRLALDLLTLPCSRLSSAGIAGAGIFWQGL